MRIRYKKGDMIDIMYYVGLGFVFGWFSKVMLSDSEVRRLRRINEALIKHRDELEDRLKQSESMYKKERNSLLDLRRRYDKIYSNNYNKFK